MSNEERISEIDAELKKHWAVIKKHQDVVKILVEEKKSLKTVDQKTSIPDMSIGELLRRSGADEFEYNSTGYNPYREVRDRLEAWSTSLIPDNQTFEFDRYLKAGADPNSYAFGDCYMTPKLTPRHPSALTSTAGDLADGVQQHRAACIIAFGLDDDVDLIFGVMSNDLSERGIIQFLSHVGEVGEVTITTYGRTTTLFKGTTAECMDYLQKNCWYGEPYVDRDDRDDYY